MEHDTSGSEVKKLPILHIIYEPIRENTRARGDGEKKVKVSMQKRKSEKESLCVHGGVRELNSFTVLAFSSNVEQPC